MCSGDGVDKADWTWPDERLNALRASGVTPIAGLVHHGSGPQDTSLVDPAFAERLAECLKCMSVKIRVALAERVSLEREICAKMRNFP